MVAKDAEERRLTVERLAAKEAAESATEKMKLENAQKLHLLERQNTVDRVDKEREYELTLKAIEKARQ